MAVRPCGLQMNIILRSAAHSTFSRRAGFTLIELLVVVAIIAIMVGIVIGISGYASRKSAFSRAITDLETIKTAIEEYRIERGGYPSFSGPIDGGTFSNDVGPFAGSGIHVVDPWGRGYIYQPQGPVPVRSYRLYSEGPSTSSVDDVDSASGSY